MENTAYKSFTHSSDEERALLRRLIAGEMAAYETLFHRYYPTFCAFVRGMTKDTFVSEDITQNIFLKVWINRERLDEEKSIRNYLFVLAKHEVYNYLRTKNRTFPPLREVVSGSDARGGEIASSHNETEETLDLHQTAELVESIVRRMPDQRQLIFRLSRFEHRSNKEIARLLNLSVRTVDKHIELAVKELRRYIGVIPAIILFLEILP